MTTPLQHAQDDGLVCGVVGEWAEEKYRLLDGYFRQFANGTKKKWPHRTYIDLYAGSGYGQLRSNGEILLGSPMLALSVPSPFNQYVFCESNPDYMSALRQRVGRDYSTANVTFIADDCTTKIEEIINSIPAKNSLGLCFIDPFDLSIEFSLLEKLARRRLDILCLLALHMDANRAYETYLHQESSKVDRLLGTAEWKGKWLESQRPRHDFPLFLAEYFASRMKALGFHETPTHSMHLVRTNDRNVPLYHLALFSRSQLAYKFWEQSRDSSTPQRKLF